MAGPVKKAQEEVEEVTKTKVEEEKDVVVGVSNKDKLEAIDVAIGKYRRALLEVTGINTPHTIGVLDKLINDLKQEVVKILG